VSIAKAAILALLLAMLLAFATERWRVETVALGGLASGFATGLVPARYVFAGFASPAVITVVEILLIVSVLSRSRLVDEVARRVTIRITSERALFAVLCATGAFVSVFMNNIGALALLFPVAISMAQRLQVLAGRILMALSFATLLGGMCSLKGTPANLVANEWMISQTGRSMGYFDLAVAGLPLALIGIAWLVAASPKVFARFAAVSPAGEDAAQIGFPFIAQHEIATRSRFIGMRPAEIETRCVIRRPRALILECC